MRILELQEYAKDNGFDSLKFKFTNLFGQEKKGHWIDAYFGFFWIEGMDENTFMTVSQWRQQVGDELIEFELDDAQVFIVHTFCRRSKIKLNLKTEKKEVEKTWRNDFETYLSDCKRGYASIINDSEFMERLQKLNPKINIRSSLEMGFIAYWGSEEGWKNKKSKKSKTIDWKSTIIKTIKLNAVYY